MRTAHPFHPRAGVGGFRGARLAWDQVRLQGLFLARMGDDGDPPLGYAGTHDGREATQVIDVEEKWLIRSGERIFTAKTLPQLLEWVRIGRVPPDARIFNPNSGVWMPASRVSELSPTFAEVRPSFPCPHCGRKTLVRVEGLQGRENAVGALLTACFVLPGIFYYVTRSGPAFYCTRCERRVKEPSLPAGPSAPAERTSPPPH